MSNFVSRVIPQLGRFLYTHNPFYLIGTLLVLYGLQQSLGQDPTLATSTLLVGLLAAYAVLLAAIAYVVIRLGQVWDDARTILLVIVLTFFMLSTSLDYHLLFTLEAPVPGTYCLIGGLAFSIAVSETVLRGLRIGLPASYRIPYYLVLMLLFGYPVLLGWMNYYSYYDELAWVLLAFPLATSIAFLTLLPAARTLPQANVGFGTPWPWPYYPWSLYVFLTIGIAIRAWWLTIAFEPAKGPETYFRLYFLLPLVLAWAVLVLEMALVRSSKVASYVAMCLPLCGLLFAFPGQGQSSIEIEFLHRLSQTIGSPTQIAVWGLIAFFCWAWLRGEPAAEVLLLILGILAAVIGPATMDLSTFRPPALLNLAVVGLALFAQAIRFRSTWRAICVLIIAVIAARFSGIAISGIQEESIQFWKWHGPLLLVLTVPLLFEDRLSRVLRVLTWHLTPCLGLVAVFIYPWIMPALPHSVLIAYLAALLIVSLALWIKQRDVKTLAAGLVTLAANLLVFVRPIYLLLAQTVMAKGLVWMTIGLLTVIIALVISLLKMGTWYRAKRAMEWLNERVKAAHET